MIHEYGEGEFCDYWNLVSRWPESRTVLGGPVHGSFKLKNNVQVYLYPVLMIVVKVIRNR